MKLFKDEIDYLKHVDVLEDNQSDFIQAIHRIFCQINANVKESKTIGAIVVGGERGTQATSLQLGEKTSFAFMSNQMRQIVTRLEKGHMRIMLKHFENILTPSL